MVNRGRFMFARSINAKNMIFSFASIIFLLAIINASFIPVYPDEVAYQIFLGRYFIDGGLKQSLTPYCGEGFLVSVPVVLKPAAIFLAAIFSISDSVVVYRALPLLLVFAALFCVRIIKARIDKYVAATALLVASCSVFLYSFVIIRPEVFIWACMFVILLSSRYFFDGMPPLKRVFCLFAVSFLFSACVFIHPKSLYFSPVLISLYLIKLKDIWGNKFATIIYVIIASLFLVVLKEGIWLHSLQFLTCNEFPAIESSMASQSVNFLSTQQSFHSVIGSIFSYDQLLKFLDRVILNDSYQINYLPPWPSITKFINIINAALIATIGLIYIICWVLIFKGIFRLSLNKEFVTYIFFFSVNAVFFTNMVKNWYDVSLFVVMLITSFVFLFSYIKNTTKILEFSFSIICTVLIIVATSGLFYTFKYNTLPFLQGWHGPGVSLFLDRSAITSAVNEFLSYTSVDLSGGVVVDDYTYTDLKYYRPVLPITYLGIGVSQNPAAVRYTLNNLGVRYGIVQCQNFYAIKDLIGFRLLRIINVNPNAYYGFEENQLELCFFDFITS